MELSPVVTRAMAAVRERRRNGRNASPATHVAGGGGVDGVGVDDDASTTTSQSTTTVRHEEATAAIGLGPTKATDNQIVDVDKTLAAARALQQNKLRSTMAKGAKVHDLETGGKKPVDFIAWYKSVTMYLSFVSYATLAFMLTGNSDGIPDDDVDKASVDMILYATLFNALGSVQHLYSAIPVGCGLLLLNKLLANYVNRSASARAGARRAFNEFDILPGQSLHLAACGFERICAVGNSVGLVLTEEEKKEQFLSKLPIDPNASEMQRTQHTLQIAQFSAMSWMDLTTTFATQARLFGHKPTAANEEEEPARALFATPPADEKRLFKLWLAERRKKTKKKVVARQRVGNPAYTGCRICNSKTHYAADCQEEATDFGGAATGY